MGFVRIAHPGRPTRIIRDAEPVLTKRQEQVLHVVRAHNGNRSHAARQLGVNISAIQKSLKYAKAAGASVPVAKPGRKGIPDSTPRKIGPRCGEPTRRGVCGRPQGHPATCITEDAWFRNRSPHIARFR